MVTLQSCRDELRSSRSVDAIDDAITAIQDDLEDHASHYRRNPEERQLAWQALSDLAETMVGLAARIAAMAPRMLDRLIAEQANDTDEPTPPTEPVGARMERAA